MQWHQLDHMQTICTSLQTSNHISTSSLNFYRPDALPDTHCCIKSIYHSFTSLSPNNHGPLAWLKILFLKRFIHLSFLVRHISFMRICNCRIFRLLLHFSHISAKWAYRIFFPHKLAFLTANLIFFVFQLYISTTFRYLSHLVANRMAPSMCLDPCGTRCSGWF